MALKTEQNRTEASMLFTIAKWGNSLALRLPRHIVDDVKFAEGQSVEIEVVNDTLVIRPTRQRFKLADLLAGYERNEAVEADWGQPKGDEAW